MNGHSDQTSKNEAESVQEEVDREPKEGENSSPMKNNDINGINEREIENRMEEVRDAEFDRERGAEYNPGNNTEQDKSITKEDEELQNIVANRRSNVDNIDKDINLERISRTLAGDFCVTPTRSIDTPTRAIEGLNKAVRDSPGLWKSTIDPVDFPELETSASNFFEMNQLSEQIAATADSMTSEGDIAELLGVASEAEEKMKTDREAEETKESYKE